MRGNETGDTSPKFLPLERGEKYTTKLVLRNR